MKRALRRIGIFVIGWTLILVGLLLSLPGIPGPGLLTAFIGLMVLSAEYHWAHRWMEGIRRRFPKFAELMDRGKARAQGWFRRPAPPAPECARSAAQPAAKD